MCGIVGLLCGDNSYDALTDLTEALHQLQHRGQDGCGIATSSRRGHFGKCYKGKGLLSDVFGSQRGQKELQGPIGIGHVRYQTSGSSSVSELQPLVSRDRHEIYLAHNGHVSTPGKVKHSSLDSRLILSIFSRALAPAAAMQRGDSLRAGVPIALRQVYHEIDGAFACTAMIDGHLLIGFRDPYGIKPLVLGHRRTRTGAIDYLFASESVALEKLGFVIDRDVLPGEVIMVDSASTSHRMSSANVVPASTYCPDIFEFVYFARTDSVMDGISVHKCRQRQGHALGLTIAERSESYDLPIDIVVPVPETSYVAAIETAKVLQKPLSLALVKNRYVSRSFIMPGQAERSKAISRKFSVVNAEVDGKVVLLVDDSIVRGTTSREIVSLIYKAGARAVIFASAYPAVRFNHIYGVALADPQALVAHRRTESEVAAEIGADAVLYMPLERLVESCLQERTSMDVVDFEVGMFTGEYVTELPYSREACQEGYQIRTSMSSSSSE